MTRLLISLAVLGALVWFALRFLARIGRLTRPAEKDKRTFRKPTQDPVLKAKKADVIDVK
jgi:hypothetical protein